MSADLEALERAAAKDPALLVKLADSLVADGRAEDAIRTCRRALLERPDDVPLRLALARALSAAGQLEEAQAALLDATARERRLRGAGCAPPLDGRRDPPPEEEQPEIEDVFDDAPTRQALRADRLAMYDPEPSQPPRSEKFGENEEVTGSYRPEHTERLRNEYGFNDPPPTNRQSPNALRESLQRLAELQDTDRRAHAAPDTDRQPARDTDPHARGGDDSGFDAEATNDAMHLPVNLELVARQLLGGAKEPSLSEVMPTLPVDEMALAWDKKRMRSFIWLWVTLGLVAAGSTAFYLHREAERKKQLDALVTKGDARSIEATFEAERDAHDLWQQAVRLDPRARRYFALASYGNARLAADQGDDTDAAAWAMMKRAEREQKLHPEPPGADPRADRDQRQARALMALARGEACTETQDTDGDVAARCALQRGDIDAARRILSATIQGAPGVAALRPLLVLASLELGQGDLDAADKAYTEVLGRAAGQPRALVGKALIALERGETPSVTPPAGRLGPMTEAWFHLAAGLAELGRQDGDEKLASSELELAKKGVVHDGRLALLYGRARLMQGRVGEAEEAMRIAERLSPNDGDVAVLDAEVALAKGLEDKVATTLQAGTSPRQLAVLGRALCLVGKYREAEADLKAALARRPGDATAITYLAITRAHLGDAAGSQKALEKAAATLQSSTPHYGLGLLAYERHDLTRARSELEKALSHNSESFRARALLGRALMELGKPAEALKELEQVSREAPALLSVHSTLGRLYLTLGRDREARSELRRVIDAGKASVDDKLAFAEATVDLGFSDEGEAAIQAAADAGALAPKVARLKLLLSTWKGPQPALLAARTLERERRGPAARDAKLAIAAAHAWRRAGDLRKAGEDYSAALLGDALHANLGLGKVQLAQNDLSGAETSYKAALAAWERGPFGVDDQTEARVGLGRALVARRAFDEAVTTLTPSLTNDATAPEPRYWLARAYSEKGQLDKARSEAERATQIDDKYADAFALYGDLVRQADPVKARKAYKRYLEIAPDGDKSKAVKTALKNLK
jgi:tetratricopeptide (TPR) repeat protein